MKTKKKNILRLLIALAAVLAIVYASLPYYARQALIHWMPVIDDLETFHRHTVHHNPDNVWHWPLAADYNRYQLTEEDARYLDSLHTVSFLVIRHDSIVFESYRDRWNDTLTSNIYSATKTIVGLLAGIAFDEGKIHSYYGNDLYELVTGLDVVDQPGVQYSYRSGETQLLAFVIEAATGKTLSDYAEEKLWKPMQAEHDAYWLLDKEDGDEKAFCCFHTTARDVARFARLLLHRGNWQGRQLVSEAYMDELMRPASYLKDQWGKDTLSYYGFQTWVMDYHGMRCPYLRGMLGQYIIAIPQLDAIVVRLGRKRCDVYNRELTTDITRYMDVAMKILKEN